MLKADQKTQIESAILNRIVEIKQQIKLAKSSSQTVALDQTLAGRVSRIDAIQQQKMAQSALVRDSKLLLELEKSLSNLLKPEFGICAECDELIPFERLLVKPEVEFCVACQQLNEE